MTDKDYGNLYWRLESSCPLRCVMCSSDHLIRTIKGYENTLLDQAKEIGFKTIVFTGGEPTLREGLPYLLRQAGLKGFMTRLDTNGVYLNGTQVALIKPYLTMLGLPLHGSTAEAHDLVVGKKGHFNAIKCIADSSTRRGLSLKITTAVTKENISDVKNIADYLNHSIHPEIYGVNALVKRNCNPQAYQKLKIEEEEFENLKEELLSQNYPFKLSFCFGHKDSDMAYIFVNPDFTISVTAGDSEHIIGDLKNERLEKILSKVKINHELHMRRFEETNI